MVEQLHRVSAVGGRSHGARLLAAQKDKGAGARPAGVATYRTPVGLNNVSPLLVPPSPLIPARRDASTRGGSMAADRNGLDDGADEGDGGGSAAGPSTSLKAAGVTVGKRLGGPILGGSEHKRQTTVASLFAGQQQRIAAARPTPAGLVNLGNTCYLNSVVQVLLHVPAFAADLLHPDLAAMRPGPAAGGVWAALRDTLQRLRTATAAPPALDRGGMAKHPVEPASLRTAMGRLSTRWRATEQQDAHEFLVALTEGLQGEVLAAEAATSGLRRVRLSATRCPASRNLGGCLVHTWTCTRCGHSTRAKEPFSCLSLQLPPQGRPHVTELIDDFLKDETVSKNCDACSSSAAVPHTAQHRLWRLPRLLVVHIKRFMPQQQQQPQPQPQQKAQEQVPQQPACAGEQVDTDAVPAPPGPDAAPATPLRDEPEPPTVFGAAAAPAAPHRARANSSSGGGAAAGTSGGGAAAQPMAPLPLAPLPYLYAKVHTAVEVDAWLDMSAHCDGGARADRHLLAGVPPSALLCPPSADGADGDAGAGAGAPAAAPAPGVRADGPAAAAAAAATGAPPERTMGSLGGGSTCPSPTFPLQPGRSALQECTVQQGADLDGGTAWPHGGRTPHQQHHPRQGEDDRTAGRAGGSLCCTSGADGCAEGCADGGPGGLTPMGGAAPPPGWREQQRDGGDEEAAALPGSAAGGRHARGGGAGAAAAAASAGAAGRGALATPQGPHLGASGGGSNEPGPSGGVLPTTSVRGGAAARAAAAAGAHDGAHDGAAAAAAGARTSRRSPSELVAAAMTPLPGDDDVAAAEQEGVLTDPQPRRGGVPFASYAEANGALASASREDRGGGGRSDGGAERPCKRARGERAATEALAPGPGPAAHQPQRRASESGAGPGAGARSAGAPGSRGSLPPHAGGPAAAAAATAAAAAGGHQRPLNELSEEEQLELALRLSMQQHEREQGFVQCSGAGEGAAAAAAAAEGCGEAGQGGGDVGAPAGGDDAASGDEAGPTGRVLDLSRPGGGGGGRSRGAGAAASGGSGGGRVEPSMPPGWPCELPFGLGAAPAAGAPDWGGAAGSADGPAGPRSGAAARLGAAARRAASGSARPGSPGWSDATSGGADGEGEGGGGGHGPREGSARRPSHGAWRRSGGGAAATAGRSAGHAGGDGDGGGDDDDDCLLPGTRQPPASPADSTHAVNVSLGNAGGLDLIAQAAAYTANARGGLGTGAAGSGGGGGDAEEEDALQRALRLSMLTFEREQAARVSGAGAGGGAAGRGGADAAAWESVLAIPDAQEAEDAAARVAAAAAAAAGGDGGGAAGAQARAAGSSGGRGGEQRGSVPPGSSAAAGALPAKQFASHRKRKSQAPQQVPQASSFQFGFRLSDEAAPSADQRGTDAADGDDPEAEAAANNGAGAGASDSANGAGAGAPAAAAAAAAGGAGSRREQPLDLTGDAAGDEDEDLQRAIAMSLMENGGCLGLSEPANAGAGAGGPGGGGGGGANDVDVLPAGPKVQLVTDSDCEDEDGPARGANPQQQQEEPTDAAVAAPLAHASSLPPQQPLQQPAQQAACNGGSSGAAAAAAAGVPLSRVARYRLCGVVRHKGLTPFSGHYVADVFVAPHSRGGQGAWYEHNDSVVGRVDLERVRADAATQGYMLFYVNEATLLRDSGAQQGGGAGAGDEAPAGGRA